MKRKVKSEERRVKNPCALLMANIQYLKRTFYFCEIC
nr:MAG TPA: protein of unknown function (DUF4187) [Caudoviricetes sp.]